MAAVQEKIASPSAMQMEVNPKVMPQVQAPAHYAARPQVQIAQQSPLTAQMRTYGRIANGGHAPREKPGLQLKGKGIPLKLSEDSNVLQARWIAGQTRLRWDTLLEGIQWYYVPGAEPKMHYAIEDEKAVAHDKLAGYQQYEGIKKTRAEWLALSGGVDVHALLDASIIEAPVIAASPTVASTASSSAAASTASSSAAVSAAAAAASSSASTVSTATAIHGSSGAAVAEEKDVKDINWVFQAATVAEFVARQTFFQKKLTHLGGLRSVGYEFEFGSFTAGRGIAHVDDEIKTSHQVLALSSIAGNFFNLPWRLETDAYNTLELVSPPFLFTADDKEGIIAWEGKMEIEAKAIADGFGTREIDEKESKKYVATQILSEGISNFGPRGLGQNWRIETGCGNLGVIKKNKQGDHTVYSQRNIAMTATEVGDELVTRMRRQDPTFEGDAKSQVISGRAVQVVNSMEPVGVLGQIARILLDAGPDSEKVLTPPIAVFSRYCSNALSIPSMMWRQDHKERWDSKPTDIKEALFVWVKTDGMNILSDLLQDPTARTTFLARFTPAAEQQILAIFETIGQFYLQELEQRNGRQNRQIEDSKAQQLAQLTASIAARRAAAASASTAAAASSSAVTTSSSSSATTTTSASSATAPPMDAKATMEALTAIRAQAAAQQQSLAKRYGENQALMRAYIQKMKDEVTAFIGRVRNVATHVQTSPQSTTREFLEEKYGTGMGVRKGTYLDSIASSRGRMYVTEIRETKH
jgi:hypothetical protein